MEDRFLISLLNNRFCPDGITSLGISFSEYNELMNMFRVMTQNDRDEAYRISVKAIAWQDWFTSLQSSVGYIIKSLETDRNARIAEVCRTCGEKSMTKAEKIALSDEEVINLKKQKAVAEAIYGLLDDKVKILEKVFYFCRAISSQPISEHVQ